jgi:hypothetical protein
MPPTAFSDWKPSFFFKEEEQLEYWDYRYVTLKYYEQKECFKQDRE